MKDACTLCQNGPLLNNSVGLSVGRMWTMVPVAGMQGKCLHHRTHQKGELTFKTLGYFYHHKSLSIFLPTSSAHILKFRMYFTGQQILIFPTQSPMMIFKIFQFFFSIPADIYFLTQLPLTTFEILECLFQSNRF